MMFRIFGLIVAALVLLGAEEKAEETVAKTASEVVEAADEGKAGVVDPEVELVPERRLPAYWPDEFVVQSEAEEGDAFLLEANGVVLRVPTKAVDDKQIALALLELYAENRKLIEQESDQSWRVERGHLVDWSFRTEDIIVSKYGVLHKQEVPPDPYQKLKSEADRLLVRLLGEVNQSDLDEITRHTLHTLLRNSFILVDKKEQKLNLPFIQELVTEGYFRKYLKDSKSLIAYEKLLQKVQQGALVEKYTGANGLEVKGYMSMVVKDRAWVSLLANGKELARVYTFPFCNEQYGKDLPNIVRVEWDSQSIGDYKKAHFTVGGDYDDDILVTWSASAGFECNKEAWNSWFYKHVEEKSMYQNYYLPPHIPVIDRENGFQFLITEHGVLEAPTAFSDQQEWMKQAVAVLPGQSYLDLIWRYMYRYTFDSPRNEDPTLVGSKASHGDIQQTAAQVIDRCVMGRMLGDCDDYSELMHDILKLQGKNPVVIKVPRHLACAWAEFEDGKWVVQILHTGTPLRFVDKHLPSALTNVYKYFDPNDSRDPEVVSLALRHDDQLLRSRYWLSWRIFTEPEYAELMYSVQRDWFYGIFGNGLSKMEGLIAAGDEDHSNWSETAGLYARTGRYRQANQFYGKVISGLDDKSTAFGYRMRQLRNYVDGDHVQEALSLVGELVEEMEQIELSPFTQLKNYNTIHGFLKQLDTEESKKKLLKLSVVKLMPIAMHLGKFFNKEKEEGAFKDGKWRRNTEFRGWFYAYGNTVRNLQIAYRVWNELPQQLKREQIDLLQRAVQYYVDHFTGISGDEVKDTYAQFRYLAAWYVDLLSEDVFLALLTAVKPYEGKPDTTGRLSGLAQVHADLKFIHNIPQFWEDLLRRRIADTEKRQLQVDESILKLMDKQRDAFEVYAKYMDNPREVARQRQRMELTQTLLRGDNEKLKEVFSYYAEQRSHRKQSSAFSLIIQYLRVLPTEQGIQVVRDWFEHASDKPSCFRFAWRLALSDNWDYALLLADLTCEKYSDDQIFVKERELMQKRFQEVSNPVEEGLPIENEQAVEETQESSEENKAVEETAEESNQENEDDIP